MFLNEDELDHLIEGLRTGKEEAVFYFWKHYSPILKRLADKNLAQGLRRRLGPEDVVQSACRTFLRRAQAGEFEIPDGDSLWRLLCAITLTKIRQQSRFHGQQKRNIQREQHLDSVKMDGRPKVPQVAANEDSPAEAAEFADQMRQLIESLGEKEREILELKLQELENQEIARQLGCAERTVRRRLQRIEAVLRGMLNEGT